MTRTMGIRARLKSCQPELQLTRPYKSICHHPRHRITLFGATATSIYTLPSSLTSPTLPPTQQSPSRVSCNPLLTNKRNSCSRMIILKRSFDELMSQNLLLLLFIEYFDYKGSNYDCFMNHYFHCSVEYIQLQTGPTTTWPTYNSQDDYRQIDDTRQRSKIPISKATFLKISHL